jgi:hypothetical protein
MPNRLQRKSKANLNDALQALANAFQVEAERQQHEKVESARLVALKEREAIFLACPVSWPMMMTEEMSENYCRGLVVLNGTEGGGI